MGTGKGVEDSLTTDLSLPPPSPFLLTLFHYSPLFFGTPGRPSRVILKIYPEDSLCHDP